MSREVWLANPSSLKVGERLDAADGKLWEVTAKSGNTVTFEEVSAARRILLQTIAFLRRRRSSIGFLQEPS